MSTSTVSKQGRIVIPADVRADLRISAGTRLEFTKTPEGWSIKTVLQPMTALKGLPGQRSTTGSVEEMNRAVRVRAADRDCK